MIDFDIQLTEYLGQTTIDAAAAGLHLIDWIVGMDEGIQWTVQNGCIQFETTQPFCTLQPQPNHILCTLHDNGHTRSVSVKTVADITHTLCNQVNAAYQHTILTAR